MTNNESFRWKVWILDDQCDDVSIDSTKLNLGGFASVLAVSEQDLEDYLSDGFPDLMLIDVKWAAARQQVPASFKLDALPLPYALTSDGATRRRFVRDWILLLHKGSTTHLYRWCDHIIMDVDWGLWLAALASHLFPETPLVLYSQFPDVHKQRNIAPWLAFRNAPLQLLTKSSTKGITVQQLVPFLEPVQRSFLSKHPAVRAWAQSSVWLPMMLGAEPISADCTFLNKKGSFVNQMFRPEVFFPQLLLNSGDVRNQIAALSFPTSPVVQEELMCLNMAAHKIRNLCDGVKVDEAENWFKTSAQYLGPLSNRVMSTWKTDLEKAWCYIYTRLTGDGIPIINRTCNGNQLPSSPEFSCPFPPPHLPLHLPTRDRLPLDLIMWENAVEALRDNDIRYGRGDGGKLSADLREKELTVTFLGKGGFKTIRDFHAAILKSLQRKSELRGLPLVLLFSQRHHARSLQVLIGKHWTDVFSKRIYGLSKHRGFGLRFTLPIN